MITIEMRERLEVLGFDRQYPQAIPSLVSRAKGYINMLSYALISQCTIVVTLAFIGRKKLMA